jgi:transketolase
MSAEGQAQGTQVQCLRGAAVPVEHRLLALGEPDGLDETELARAVRDFIC